MNLWVLVGCETLQFLGICSHSHLIIYISLHILLPVTNVFTCLCLFLCHVFLTCMQWFLSTSLPLSHALQCHYHTSTFCFVPQKKKEIITDILCSDSHLQLKPVFQSCSSGILPYVQMFHVYLFIFAMYNLLFYCKIFILMPFLTLHFNEIANF